MNAIQRNVKFVLAVLFLFALLFLMPLPQQATTEQTPQKNQEVTNELLFVAGSANMEKITRLIQEGADVNAVDGFGNTVLMFAALGNSNPDVLRVLIENGADVNAAKNDGITPLMFAANRNSNPDITQVLIKNDAGVNAADNEGRTPLMLAAVNNSNPDVLRVLIENEVDVNITAHNGMTPLMFAARRNPNPDIMQVLIENGAIVNTADNEGRTPLMFAVENNLNLEIIRTLIENNADINATKQDGMTSLLYAINRRNFSFDVLQILIENGADVNAADKDGITPLISAVNENKVPYFIRFLLENGADVNAADKNGMTPLMYASINSNIDVLRIFLENGADINAANNDGKTPLMLAANTNSTPAILQTLLENGADVGIKDNNGKRALDYAENNERLRVHYFREVRVADDVNLNLYHPWSSSNQLPRLDSPASLRISGNFPRLDGATSAYPLFAAVANEVYEVSDKVELQQYLAISRTEEAYNRLIRGEVGRLLWGEVNIIFVLQPSDEQLESAKNRAIELHFTPIAKDAFVFFANSRNPVSNLSIEQIRDIYRKNITNWQEVGGNDRPIRPYQRQANSGSQTAMIKEVMKGENLAPTIMLPRSRAMAGIVYEVAQYQNHEDAIGYSFRFFTEEMMRNTFEADYFQLMIDLIPRNDHDSCEIIEKYQREMERAMQPIKLLAVDGITPSEENIRNGTYPFTVNLYAVVRGDRRSNPHVQELIDWILSPQGQELVEKTGYVGVATNRN